MTFSDAIQNLTNGRAAKPASWGGYVARVDRPAAFSADSAAGVYAVGDLVTYGGAVYRCSAAVSTGGSWSGASNWVKLYDLLPEFSAESTYAVGAKVLRDGTPYECVSAVASAGAWDSSKWARLPDVPHALVFQERSDADNDSATVYVAKCEVSLSGGRRYGDFAPEFSVDPALLYAVVWDSTWSLGDVAAFEAARSGSTRW